MVVEYEPDPDLRATEQISFLDAPSSGNPGGLPSEASAKEGIEAFLRREVLPHAADAWYVPDSVRTGYEVSFTRYFYKPQPLRTLEEIRADILALERETEGLLAGDRGEPLKVAFVERGAATVPMINTAFSMGRHGRLVEG